MKTTVSAAAPHTCHEGTDTASSASRQHYIDTGEYLTYGEADVSDAPYPASDRRPTVSITREQIEEWAGRALTDDEVAELDDAIPQSSIPEAIGVIADSLGSGS